MSLQHPGRKISASDDGTPLYMGFHPSSGKTGSMMATNPTDPPLFYASHVFCCTNTRPAGHPRGCCSEKGAEKLRNYMKVRAKELGLRTTRINAAGCLDRCEFGPTMVIYPEGV